MKKNSILCLSVIALCSCDSRKETGEAESLKKQITAAEQGDAAAQYLLGCKFANGEGLPKDHTEAVKWFRKAAEQGNVEAQTELGLRLSVLYYGKGVPIDEVESAMWFRKAAEQGYAEAQYQMGVCYTLAKGVRTNRAEATKWIRKAAEQRHAKAQFDLGLRFALGDGVPKDLVMAYMWCDLADANGAENTSKIRGTLSSEMTREQIAEAKKLSREWKPKVEE